MIDDVNDDNDEIAENFILCSSAIPNFQSLNIFDFKSTLNSHFSSMLNFELLNLTQYNEQHTTLRSFQCVEATLFHAKKFSFEFDIPFFSTPKCDFDDSVL